MSDHLELRAEPPELDEAGGAGPWEGLPEPFLLAPVALVVTDNAGLVRDANLEALSLFNVERRYLSHKPIATLFAADERRKLRSFLTKARPLRDVSLGRFHVVARSRPRLAVDVRARGAAGPGGEPLLYWAITDVAVEEGAGAVAEIEERLARHAQRLDLASRRLELLAAAGRIMVGAGPAPKILDGVCDLLGTTYASCCWAEGCLPPNHGAEPFPTSVGKSQEWWGARRIRGHPSIVASLSQPELSVVLDELTRTAVSKAQPVILYPEEEQGGRSLLAGVGAQVVAAVPIVAPSGVIGALGVALAEGRPSLPGFWGEADVNFLEDLAARLGLALERARLLEAQTMIVSTLQSSLRPRQLPDVEGLDLAATYRSAVSPVGGDFYDVVATPRGHAILIGDVSGKGTEAATVTARARHTIAALASLGAPPEKVLSMLNGSLHEHPAPERFITVAVAMLSPARPPRQGWDVNLMTGGHPPAIVVTSAGSVREVGGGGTLIGLFDDAEPASAKAHLDPGDTLLLYTDGVSEACGPDGFFGEIAFSKTLRACAGMRATDLVAAVEESALLHAGGVLRDDMTMVAVKALPKPPMPL